MLTQKMFFLVRESCLLKQLVKTSYAKMQGFIPSSSLGHVFLKNSYWICCDLPSLLQPYREKKVRKCYIELFQCVSLPSGKSSFDLYNPGRCMG